MKMVLMKMKSYGILPRPCGRERYLVPRALSRAPAGDLTITGSAAGGLLPALGEDSMRDWPDPAVRAEPGIPCWDIDLMSPLPTRSVG